MTFLSFLLLLCFSGASSLIPHGLFLALHLLREGRRGHLLLLGFSKAAPPRGSRCVGSLLVFPYF